MIFLDLFRPHGLDFQIYYAASWIVLHGLNVYALTNILNPFPEIIRLPFDNAPPAFFLYGWFALFPKHTSGVIWNLLSTGSLLLSIFLLLKIVQKKVNYLAFVCLVFLFTVPFFPSKNTIGNGQNNHLILLFVVASFYLYKLKQKLPSAALLALSIATKVAPLMFLYYFFLKRDFRQIAKILGFTLLIWSLSLLLIPWESQKNFFLFAFPGRFDLTLKAIYYNQSLQGFLARSTTTNLGVVISYLAFSGLAILATFLRRQKVSSERLFSAVACLYLILHPMAQQHYYVFSIIPLILLGFAKKPKWLPLILSYILISWNIKDPASIPRELNLVLSHQFVGILLLWILALWQDRFWILAGVILLSLFALSLITIPLCHAGICL